MADVRAGDVRFNTAAFGGAEHPAAFGGAEHPAAFGGAEHPAAFGGGALPAVVFVHGLVMDNLASFYYTLAGPVAAAGFQAVLYDLRGHGRSERPPTGYRVTDAVADLVGILDAMGVHRPAICVGNSFGGLVATRTALAHPHRVAGLVLIESHCGGDTAGRWIEEMTNTLSAVALGLERDRVHEQLSAIGQRRLARQAGSAHALLNETTLIDDLAATTPLDAAGLAGLGCPVLGIYGGDSDLVDAGHELARHVPGAVVRVLPGFGHTVLRDAASTVGDLMMAWLER